MPWRMNEGSLRVDMAKNWRSVEKGTVGPPMGLDRCDVCSSCLMRRSFGGQIRETRRTLVSAPHPDCIHVCISNEHAYFHF